MIFLVKIKICGFKGELSTEIEAENEQEVLECIDEQMNGLRGNDCIFDISEK